MWHITVLRDQCTGIRQHLKNLLLHLKHIIMEKNQEAKSVIAVLTVYD